MWDGHLESQKNPDRLKRGIHVDRIGVHNTFVYIYAGLQTLMIWANCLFSFNVSFLLRKVEDVTTISKSQSLISVSIKDCTLRVPNESNTLFLLRVIIKASFIQRRRHRSTHVTNVRHESATTWLYNDKGLQIRLRDSNICHVVSEGYMKREYLTRFCQSIHKTKQRARYLEQARECTR